MRKAHTISLMLLVACGGGSEDGDSGMAQDASASVDFGMIAGDGGGVLRGTFTISGCEMLTADANADGVPLCTGAAPLTVTFVPLTSGVSTFRWKFEDGDPTTSNSISPTVTFAEPRETPYQVTLTAGGASGTTSGLGKILVLPAALGAPCASDDACGAPPRRCVCGSAQQDGGVGDCPGEIEHGLCTRACTGDDCGTGAVCADLSRGGSSAPWRIAMCLPSCASASDCRPGLSCRELPVLTGAGGDYVWRKACFADVLADDGGGCAAPSGAPDSSRCLSGRCDPIGARGLCTSPCASCNAESACAHFGVDMGVDRCLRRCASGSDCNDPFLDCEQAGQMGSQAFVISPDLGAATFCAPKRCAQASDCGPAGACVDQYCAKN